MRTTALSALVLAVLVTGCGGASAGAAPTRSASAATPTAAVPSPGSKGDFVLLDFEGEDAFAPTAQGSQVQVDALRKDQPVARVTSGDGSRGLRFPRFALTEDAPRMVLVVNDASSGRASVDPTTSGRLSFGADLKLDRDAGSGPFDNGDNVVQRGLFADPSQYKLQVDKRVPSCTVRSSEASAFVKLPEPMVRGWYRVGCDYQDGVLTVSAAQMQDGEVQEPVRASVDVEVGPLAFDPSTPLSIGGKISGTGAMVLHQPDQFNGVLDNVFVAPGL